MSNPIQEQAFLAREKEAQLIEDWQKKQDPKACEQLLKNHKRLISKMAHGYRGYGLPLSDLIAEGHIGMLHALKNFDAAKGWRLSTYSVWWIKAAMIDFILKMASVVRIARTGTQRKLFFKLRQEQYELEKHVSRNMSDETIDAIATKLCVSRDEVIHMHGRLSPDISLQSPISDDSGNKTEWQEWLPDNSNDYEQEYIYQEELNRRQALFDKAVKILNEREQDILIKRHIHGYRLNDLAQEKNLSRERIRQIEKTALLKLRDEIKKISPLHFNSI